MNAPTPSLPLRIGPNHPLLVRGTVLLFLIGWGVLWVVVGRFQQWGFGIPGVLTWLVPGILSILAWRAAVRRHGWTEIDAVGISVVRGEDHQRISWNQVTTVSALDRHRLKLQYWPFPEPGGTEAPTHDLLLDLADLRFPPDQVAVWIESLAELPTPAEVLDTNSRPEPEP